MKHCFLTKRKFVSNVAMCQTRGLLKACCICLAMSVCLQKSVMLDINLKSLGFSVETSYFDSFQPLCACGK